MEKYLNNINKKNLCAIATFLANDENQTLLMNNEIEELYKNLKDYGLDDYLLSRQFAEYNIDVLPYVEKIRSGMLNIGIEILDIPNNVEEIESESICRRHELTQVKIGVGIKKIGHHVFAGCSKLTEIIYKGTSSDWEKIDIHPKWAQYSSIRTVTCCNGREVKIYHG